MKIGKLLCATLLFPLFGSMHAVAQSDSIISKFMRDNPRMMKINMLQDETLQLVSDGKHLLFLFDVSNPHLLLRFVMEGFCVYIDPTGRKKEKFEIKMPSVADLDIEALGLKKEEPGSEAMEDKPNILPLIEPLCDEGIQYTHNNKIIHSEEQSFSMFLDVETDHLYYYVLLPIHELMKEKKIKSEWSIGVYASQIEAPNPDEGQMMPPPRMTDGKQMPESFTSEISQWIKFSFEQINSLNN